MRDLVSVVRNDSCCPDLDIKTRMIGFIVCFILGIAITILSLPMIAGGITGSPMFAVLYTLGNITSISS